MHAGAPTPSFPERVGRYELLLPIASGGMATVYLARATGVGGFERDVALKLVHSHLREDPERGIELIEEAKLGARIRHPNVVPVLDIGEDPFGIFLVMEYVECETLAGLARAARKEQDVVSMPVALRILSDALTGLHAAHELRDDAGAHVGLVHRDFSPQNILVGTDGVSRLADFGVAKAASRVGLTQTGVVKGKVRYMAPEQVRGHALDRRCDVLAAGVVAWETFTGRRLYEGGDDVPTLMKIVTEEPPSARSVRPDLPAALSDLIAAALSRDVERRPPTAEALRQRLLAACEPDARPADAAEVGRYVSRIVSPKLRDRQGKVLEVRELRLRMERVVQSAPRSGSSDSTGPPSGNQMPEPSGIARAPLPRGPTDGVEARAPQERPPRSRRAFFSGAAAATLVAIAAVALVRTAEETPAVPAEARAAPSTMPEARTVSAEATASADVQSSAAQPQPPKTEAMAPPRAPARSDRSPPAPSGSGRHRLAPNPYDK